MIESNGIANNKKSDLQEQQTPVEKQKDIKQKKHKQQKQ